MDSVKFVLEAQGGETFTGALLFSGGITTLSQFADPLGALLLQECKEF